MAEQLELAPMNKHLRAGEDALRANRYPGRVIIMGLNKDGTQALQAYALMGRSAGSKDRIFVQEGTDIRATAPRKSAKEMAATNQAELIYYRALRNENLSTHVVSNGAQTDPVVLDLANGLSLEQAIKNADVIEGVNLSRYEPDAPNYTPRITGLVDLHPLRLTAFGLAVVRKDPASEEAIYSVYEAPDVRELKRGAGYGVQTYLGDAAPGEPLPSYDQEPFLYPLRHGTVDTAHALWDVLNAENRVAVVVRAIDLETGQSAGTTIVNGQA